LLKAVREAVGIDEGDEVIVEIGDGIVLKPVKKRVDDEKLKESLRKHAEKLKTLPERRERSPSTVTFHSITSSRGRRVITLPLGAPHRRGSPPVA